jgi:8-oxo-dGTP pyrophosphatase MutT (NUDIX family)
MAEKPETIIPVHLRYSGVVLISQKKQFILQRRDNKIDTVNPGLITTFGGTCKNHESEIDCAVREIFEELCYCLDRDKLKLFTHFIKTDGDGKYAYMKFYIYKTRIDAKQLRLTEGETIELVPIEMENRNLDDYSFVCKKIITEIQHKIDMYF